MRILDNFSYFVKTIDLINFLLPSHLTDIKILEPSFI